MAESGLGEWIEKGKEKRKEGGKHNRVGQLVTPRNLLATSSTAVFQQNPVFLNGLVPKSAPSVDGVDCSDERAGNGKVLETSVGESTKLKPLGL